MTAEPQQVQFERLAAEVAGCERCPGMCGVSPVLSTLNGSPSARIMFIGEAPGRKGADRTRVPFSGDQSGKNFERFLAAINLQRADIFITSAALCNPRSESGANRKPSKPELRNCSGWLQQTLALVDPAVVVTLGSVALEAIKSVAPHELILQDAVAQLHPWHGRMLVPLYHPSPQVLASHRREAQQLSDYQTVARAIAQAESAPPALAGGLAGGAQPPLEVTT